VSWLTCQDFFQNADTFWVRFSCDSALKSLLLLVAVFLVYQAARYLPSAFRHFLLSLAFFCLLLLPVCLIWGPQWQIPFLSAPAFLPGGGETASTPGALLLLGVWVTGFSVVALRLAAGLWLTHRLRRESLLLEETNWDCNLQSISRRLGIRGFIPVLVNHRLGAAICAGVLRPCVIVPAAALDWSDEQRLTILQHELGHIKRRDNLTNLLSLVVCAFYWFNPLVWWAAARLRICREAACDDLVLNCGTRPSHYVSYLLQATSSTPSRFISVTLSQISVLKKRVLAILDPHVNRRAIRPAQVVACSFLAAVVLMCLSALQPWIIPTFTGGLAERLGLTEISGVRFASDLFFTDRSEGQGQLQANRSSRLLALPPGFLPAEGDPVLADFYSTSVITVVGPSAGTTAGAVIARHRDLSPFAPTQRSSWESAYPPVTGLAYGGLVSPGTQPPKDQSPPTPDTPPSQTPADLEVTRVKLGTLGGRLSLASDINEAGRVVGASTNVLGKSQPFLWSEAQGMSNLPCPSGDCQAIDINNSGQVLVIAFDEQGGTTASYLWSPDDTLIDIGNLGGKSTRALQVNDQGQIIGASETPFGIASAFFWSAETGMVDLGGSKALALNEHGQVVAWASSYAFFWDSATDTFLRIGELNAKAEPFDMNNRGEVVGYAHIGNSSQPRAFYWNPKDGMTEIQFQGAPAFSCAFRINDTGEVLAVTRDSENQERTFSWRPGQEEAQEQSLPDFLLPQFDWQLMSAPTSSVALIGSNLPSSKLAEELAKVDFGAPDDPSALAQPVKMNGRGQIAGNLFRSDFSEAEAVVWKIRLPKVEASIQEILKQLQASSSSFDLRMELQSALLALSDNDYQMAQSKLSTFLEALAAADSSIPPSKRAPWKQSVEEGLDRLSHFTILD
jgi:probable HAF family extracellular repeat protein